MNEFTLYKSKKKARRSLYVGIIFSVPFFLFKDEQPAWVNGLFVFIIAISLIIGIWDLFDNRPVIIISELGIYNRGDQGGIINWQIIQDAYLHDIAGGAVICLVVGEEYEPSLKKGKWKKKMVAMDKYLGYQEVNILLADIDVDVERLLAFILELIHLNGEEKAQKLKLITEGGLR